MSSHDYLSKLFLESPVPGKGFYDVGARAKREHEYEDDEIATSRAVHMPEFHNEIVMGPWIDAITNNIKHRKSGPIYIGNSISEFIRLERDINSNKSFVEGDWKRFDSSLYLRICLISICILRCFYHPKDVRADAFHYFIAERICIKDYYLPGGRIVRLLHGLPSGTKCTNLLGSIINLLCLNFCIVPFNPKNFSFAVGGDDFVIFSRIEINQDMLNKIDERSIELGMKFKFLELKFKDSSNLNDLPYFYKYTVRRGVPLLKPSDMFLRILVPWNKKYKNSSKYFSFLLDQIPLLGYPNASHLVFYSLFANMYRRIHPKTTISIKQIYKLHLNLYEKYSGKLFCKTLQDETEELYTFLENINTGLQSKDVNILLGNLPKKDLTYFDFSG
jgi:predicted small metal-binding protein